MEGYVCVCLACICMRVCVCASLEVCVGVRVSNYDTAATNPRKLFAFIHLVFHLVGCIFNKRTREISVRADN